LAWGEKVINSVLCSGGNQRMSRLLQLLDSGRIDAKSCADTSWMACPSRAPTTFTESTLRRYSGG